MAEDVTAEVEVEPLAGDDETGLAADEDSTPGEAEDDSGGDGEEEAEPEPEPAATRTPVVRSQPSRLPSAREEPPPPFNLGERVILISNTRPRTSTPIADHPVGTPGRVETVLSQTAIVRFDRAPERKEVVAFACLESTDKEAQARRKAEARALARAKREAESAAERA